MPRPLPVCALLSILVLSLGASAEEEPARYRHKLSTAAWHIASGQVWQEEPVMLRAVTRRHRPVEPVRIRIRAALAPDDDVFAVQDGSGTGTLWLRVDGAAARDAVLLLAAQPDVVRVERYTYPVYKNDDSTWLMQSGSESAGRTVFRKGLTGWGQIVAVADSGLDADGCQFRYGADRATVTAPIDTHRPPDATITNPENKVITYYVLAEAYDDSHGGFHGTHTAGDIVGDNFEHLATASAAGHDLHDGMAPGAQLVMQDIGANDGILRGLMGVSMYDLLVQAYDTGARIHNDSYGSAEISVEYDIDSSSIDAAMWEYNDLLVVFAAGNSGADQQGNIIPSSLGGTGSTAKNTLVAGASGPVELSIFGSMFYLENDLLFFSSQGPTEDQRIKPDVVAPGLVFSATSDSNTLIDLGNGRNTSDHEDDNCNVDEDWPTMGTSFSSPLTAGAATLVRQYYVDGFWLAGSPDPSSGFNPTNALVKATVINGAQQLDGVIIGMGTNYPLTAPPSFEQGWGRVNLERALHFDGDMRRTLVLDDVPNPVATNPMHTADLAPFPFGTAPIGTGEEASWVLPVAAPDEPLRITLAWSDPPAMAGANPALINDLDLTVTSGADTYRGNMNFDATGATLPSTSTDTDDRNNVEQVVIRGPDGQFRVSISGVTVGGNGVEGSTPQGYAVVATGSFLAPEILSVDPDHGEPGEELEDIQVTGEHFVDGMELTFGEGVTIEGVEIVDAEHLTITRLSIDAATAEGPRDVEATVIHTVQGIGPGLFRVGADAADGGSGDGGHEEDNGSAGCGCGQRPASHPVFLLLMVWAALWATYRAGCG